MCLGYFSFSNHKVHVIPTTRVFDSSSNSNTCLNWHLTQKEKPWQSRFSRDQKTLCSYKTASQTWRMPLKKSYEICLKSPRSYLWKASNGQLCSNIIIPDPQHFKGTPNFQFNFDIIIEFWEGMQVKRNVQWYACYQIPPQLQWSKMK